MTVFFSSYPTNINTKRKIWKKNHNHYLMLSVTILGTTRLVQQRCCESWREYFIEILANEQMFEDMMKKFLLYVCVNGWINAKKSLIKFVEEYVKQLALLLRLVQIVWKVRFEWTFPEYYQKKKTINCGLYMYKYIRL